MVLRHMQRHTDVPFKKMEVNKERKTKIHNGLFFDYVFHMNSIIIHLFMYNEVI